MCANFTMLCAAIFIMPITALMAFLSAFFSINFVSATLDLWACHTGPQLTLESRTYATAVGLGAPTSLLNLGPSQHRYATETFIIIRRLDSAVRRSSLCREKPWNQGQCATCVDDWALTDVDVDRQTVVASLSRAVSTPAALHYIQYMPLSPSWCAQKNSDIFRIKYKLCVHWCIKFTLGVHHSTGLTLWNQVLNPVVDPVWGPPTPLTTSNVALELNSVNIASVTLVQLPGILYLILSLRFPCNVFDVIVPISTLLLTCLPLTPINLKIC